MARIHALAHVDPAARIDDDAEIGPFCVIGPDVTVAEGCRLLSHVHLTGRTALGPRTVVHPYASLGGPPQSLAYRGEPTTLAIGADCVIRENVTMNVGTASGGGVTQIGERGHFMAGSHVGHDCRVGHDVIFANCATLGGHCIVGDFVFIGGLSAAHQFTRIGAYSMVGGMSGLHGDVIPFALASGNTARLFGINAVGMKRRGFPASTIATVRRAFRTLFLAAGSLEERLSAAERAFGAEPAVEQILAFIRAREKRPLCRADPVRVG